MTTKLVLVFLPTISLTIEQRICAGVNRVLAGKDYQLLFLPMGFLPEDERLLNHWYYENLATLEPDLILSFSIGLFSYSTEAIFRKVIDHFKGIPMLSIGYNLDGIPSIILDHFQGMFQLMDSVVQRRPTASYVYISGPPKNIDNIQRFSALDEALKKVGRSGEEVHVLPGDYTTKAAREAFSVYLSEVVKPADVIVCANDLMAMGVVEVLQLTSLKCPDDVWITGFDDFEYAAYMTPSLSTVHYPADELGEEAMKLGFRLLNGEDVPDLTVMYPFPVFRESTSDPAPVNVDAGPKLIAQWALLYQRDNNARKLTTLREFRRRMPVSELLKLTRSSLGELNVSQLSLFVSSLNEEGVAVFHEYGIHDHDVRLHVDRMGLPREFATVELSTYWVMCPLSIEDENYGYLITKSTPVAAEFIEFIAPHYTELLHAEALEARAERYRIQIELNERMVSLGSLVSGVAHEVNTPIGLGKLAASSIVDAVSSVKAKLTDQKLTKTDFNAFISEVEELSNVVYQSMDRAADLITSFKMVSVDQTAESRRKIDLGEYIESVLMSLRHQIKGKNIQLITHLSPGIILDTFPGAIAQLITNLFMNSLKHGFQMGSEFGEIQIHLYKLTDEQGSFELVFSDNGRGATKEVLNHIFDPFFTTSRGEGGTGLGMHIVFNLVTQKLHWTIRVDSKPKNGFRVILRPMDDLKF